jgi:hypothetical protein
MANQLEALVRAGVPAAALTAETGAAERADTFRQLVRLRSLRRCATAPLRHCATAPAPRCLARPHRPRVFSCRRAPRRCG